jgi:hypothetical protein
MVHSWAMLFQRLTEEGGGAGKDDQTAWFSSSEVLKNLLFGLFFLAATLTGVNQPPKAK